jgi:hypothetical protein
VLDPEAPVDDELGALPEVDEFGALPEVFEP